EVGRRLRLQGLEVSARQLYEGLRALLERIGRQRLEGRLDVRARTFGLDVSPAGEQPGEPAAEGESEDEEKQSDGHEPTDASGRFGRSRGPLRLGRVRPGRRRRGRRDRGCGRLWNLSRFRRIGGR